MVEQAEDQMKMARRVVSERLQVFFSELREALDPDTEGLLPARHAANEIAKRWRRHRGLNRTV